jgi:nucleoside-triphosphatase THEP1
MNNNKCNLFILGKIGVGKTLLTSRLVESNLKRLNRQSKEFSTDLTIKKGSYQVEVEIKELSNLSDVFRLFPKRVSDKNMLSLLLLNQL